MIAFDLSSIPPGSVVTSVTLQLNCSQTNSGNQTITLRARKTAVVGGLWQFEVAAMVGEAVAAEGVVVLNES